MDRVNGADYIDIGGGRRGFRDEDLGSGLVGTEVPADWLNGLQEELMTLIEAAGFVGDPTKWNLLFKAVRSQAFNFFQDTGAANAVVITPAVPFESLAKLVGVPIRIKKGAATNTDAVTCNVSGLGPIAVKTKTAGDLIATAWPSAAIDTLIYNGSFFESENGNLLASLDSAGRLTQKALYVYALAASTASFANGVSSLANDFVTSEASLDDATFSGGVLTFGPNTAGVWLIMANLGIQTPYNGWTSKPHIKKNGSTVIGWTETPCYGTSLGGNTPVFAKARFAAGDSVAAYMVQNTGSVQTNSTLSRFVATRIGI